MASVITLKLKIFVSSPGDVAEERVIAERILRRLADRYAGVVTIDPIFWEYEPLAATQTFQAGIPPTSESDVVICILWARLGTRLPGEIRRPDGTPYDSGTEYEFETAAAAHRQRGVPDLLVYRKIAEPVVSLKDEAQLLERLRQKQMLDAFVNRWFHGPDGTLVAAFHPFQDTARFEDLLESHLQRLVERRLEASGLDQVARREVAQAPPSWTAGSPFRGLEVFEKEHAPIFFGRTRAVGDVVAALREQAAEGRAFLLVLGASGAGKSSLVRAGVLPLLTQPGVIEGVGLWRHAIVRPGGASGTLFDRLAVALQGETALPELASDGTTEVELATMLRENPRSAYALVHCTLSLAASRLEAVPTTGRQPKARFLLVVDQLEELFTDERITSEERSGFITALSALARGGRVWVIATLRSDFYPLCARLPELVDLKRGDGQYDLAPPTPAEIGQMVRRPAEAAGLEFEAHPDTDARLDDVLRDAATSDPASLPLLQFTLAELYKLRTDSGVLTHAAYEKLGGVEGALATRADAVFGALGELERQHLPSVLRLLVGIGGVEGEAPIRRIAPLERLHATPAMAALTDALVAARLLTTDQDEAGHSVVRVTHEALLTRWRPVTEWLDRDRELLRYQSRVSAAASRWDREGRRADLLLPEGISLSEGTALVRFWGDDLSATEREFIVRSRRRARRARRLKQGVMVGLSLLTLLAVGFAAAAIRFAHNADRARNAAQHERDLRRHNAYAWHTNLAQREWNDTHITRVLNLLEGARPRESETDLRGFEWFYLNKLCHSDLMTLDEHKDAVNSVAFSFDGRRIASASSDHSVKVWDAVSKTVLLTLMGHTDTVRAVAFGPDGRRIASASADHTVKIWDANSGQVVFTFKEHTGAVNGVTFSPDGRTIASAGENGTVRVWDASSGTVKVRLIGHVGAVNGVAFSPDGRRIATAAEDKTVKIWDAQSEQEARTLDGHTQPVMHVAFSPDGRRIASASADKTVKVWHTDSGQEPLTLEGHTDDVWGVAFDRDGRLASASLDKTVKVWDAGSGQLVLTLRGHTGEVRGLAFSPDGRRIASASLDRTVKVWDAGTGQEPLTFKGHAGRVYAVAFSPDGRRIASASLDQTVKVWDPSSGTESQTLKGHSGDVTAVAFAPDRPRIASASTDNTVKVWDTESGKEVFPLLGHTGEVRGVAFSPDGRRIASASLDRTVKVWDAGSGQLVLTLRGHTRSVHGVAFGPYSRRIASASADNTVKVWDAESGQEKFSLEGHTDRVTGVAFSPDGRRIASASADNTVKVWDVETRQAVFTLSGHNDDVWGVTFLSHPDGHIGRIASASADNTVKLWDADSGEETLTLKGHTDRVSGVAFAPDGRRIASASFDNTVKVWDAHGHRSELTATEPAPQ